MKKICCLLMVIISAFVFSGCSCKKDKQEGKTISFTHYLRGGKSDKLKANILWEYSNGTFTKYQVAYTSYVCNDASVNYVNVIYLEITNKKEVEDSVIRDISFSTIEENKTTFNVGLWGDYKEYLKKDYYTGIENELLTKLKYAKYDFVKSVADEGYGNYKKIEGIDADAISNGTISASNVVSIVKAIFDYHIEKYY